MKVDTVAGRLYDAYNRHDSVSVAKLYTSDGTHEDIAHGRPKKGPTRLPRDFANSSIGFRMRAGSRRSASLAKMAPKPSLSSDGHLAKTMGPIASRGQRLSLRGVHVLNLRDGLINAAKIIGTRPRSNVNSTMADKEARP